MTTHKMRQPCLAKYKDFRLHFQTELDSILRFCQDGAAQGIVLGGEVKAFIRCLF